MYVLQVLFISARPTARQGSTLIFCGLLLAQVVGVDATSAQSVLTVLAQNSTAAFADYAQSIVVAVAEAQSTNVSTAVADVIGSETPGNMSEVCAHLDRPPSSNQSFRCCETCSCPLLSERGFLWGPALAAGIM